MCSRFADDGPVANFGAGGSGARGEGMITRAKRMMEEAAFVVGPRAYCLDDKAARKCALCLCLASYSACSINSFCLLDSGLLSL